MCSMTTFYKRLTLFFLIALTTTGCTSRYGAVTLNSIPSGAEVLNADTEEVIGTTPLTVIMKDTSSTRQYIALKLKKQGYQTDISHFWLSMRHKSESAARNNPKTVDVELTEQ